MIDIIFLVIGLAIGATASYFYAKLKYEGSSGKAVERNSYLEEEVNKTEKELIAEREKVQNLISQLAETKSNNEHLNEKLAQQKSDIEKLQEKFTKEFENLANKILDEKSTKFTAQNRENLDQILKPLGEKIKDFEKKVEEVYVNDSKDRSGLSEQLKTLFELNQKMTKEAANLTNALKGETKTQGNWGEFVLENLLENSGLVKDREYFIQESVKTEDGRRLQPDIIVKLSENRSIIIDSKVTLVAYEKYNSSESKEEKERALKEHIISIKNHYKDLSSKNYQDLYQLRTLDFVIMFIPIESALALAVQTDSNLFTYAFEQRILILSPSILLASLKIFSSIWQQEKQNQNALEIARQSGALYDKFQNFLKDLKNIGDKLDIAKGSYDEAFKKLKSGRGNLISSTEKIKQLGAKAKKSIEPNLLDEADFDDDTNSPDDE